VLIGRLPEVPRNLRGASVPLPKHQTCAFRFEYLGRNFLMNRTGRLQRQQPWTPFVVASAALGLALYYLHTRGRKPSPTAPEPSQVDEEQACQASDDDHKLGAMNTEERAYHERFMREAIAMVHHPFSLTLPTAMLTHHHRLNLHSRAMRHLLAVSLSRTAKLSAEA
jgi:hypothetical protein